jgi:hypothetical protein
MHAATAVDFPPLSVEIRPERPLLLFESPAGDAVAAEDCAARTSQAWQALPANIQPLAVMAVAARGNDVASRHQWFRALLAPLQEAGIPVALRVADSELARVHPVARLEELARDFTCVKGLHAVQLPFEEYYSFAGGDPIGAPAVVQWLVGAIDVAARYGRFMAVELDGIRWPRIMSNVSCTALYDKMRECRDYVLPIVQYRGAHSVPQTSALLGLWLEGAVQHWGVGPNSGWYADSRFLSPGVYGVADSLPPMPPALYRAMILNGAMAGAEAYSFGVADDLWFGVRRECWDQSIYPTLAGIIDSGLIARQDFVQKKARVAYQLAPSATAQDFHFNLRDIDGVLDAGLLIHGAYGMERPGQVTELILNTGRHYWVPLLSAHALPEALSRFATVVHPGVHTSPEAWSELLDTQHQPDGEGTACIVRVGRGTFIMNTRENQDEAQTFLVADLPAPVRGIQAERRDASVLLTWPFREGDLTYKIYRRYAVDAAFTFIDNVAQGREFTDPSPDPNQTVYYSVAALTDALETYEGTVGYGEYLVLSNVESRLAEHVALDPMLAMATSQPIEPPPSVQSSVPGWPSLDGVPEEYLQVARDVVRQVETWDRAFSGEDVNGVMGLYADDYVDPQDWRLQYVKRAYQWFFERYGACRMDRQIRRWDMSAFDLNGEVNLLLYCRLSGNAVSDSTGRFADQSAWFPRANHGEVWVTFVARDGVWRIIRTNPALPNLKDILAFSAGPYDQFALGPDQQ